MTLTLATIEQLAPDTASLDAAKKLLKPAKWSGHGSEPSLHLIWSQCQGSGSNPYYTVFDTNDQGYKCTCPSRKFPCKHSLALILMAVNDMSQFPPTSPPTWVTDWLGRRQKGTKPTTATAPNSTITTPNPTLATEPETPTLTAEELAKKKLAQAKRTEKLKADTDSSIRAGIAELEQWLQDQMRMGFGAFIDQASPRCRQISARLNDAKANSLASRIDEIPAKLVQANQPQDKLEQVKVIVKEFGQIVLLCQAWLANPDDPDARRAIAMSENKDKILSQDTLLKTIGVWQTIGEISEVRKDGLISHATWLIRLQDKEQEKSNEQTENIPQFALLLDYEHPSTGRSKNQNLGFGGYTVGELCFYPSRLPLRGFFLQQEKFSLFTDTSFSDLDQHSLANNATNGVVKFDPNRFNYPPSPVSLTVTYQQQLAKLPYLEAMPFILPKGRIAKDDAEVLWWQTDDSEPKLYRLANKALPKLILGSELDIGFMLWHGEAGELLSVVSKEWGLLSCQ